jgi:hypothetical protein
MSITKKEFLAMKKGDKVLLEDNLPAPREEMSGKIVILTQDPHSTCCFIIANVEGYKWYIRHDMIEKKVNE